MGSLLVRKAAHSAYHQLTLPTQVWIFLYERRRFAAGLYESSWTAVMGMRILMASDGLLQLIPGPEWDVSCLQRKICLTCFRKENLFVLGVLNFWIQVSCKPKYFLLLFFVKCRHRHMAKERFWKWKSLLSDKLEKVNETKGTLLLTTMLSLTD